VSLKRDGDVLVILWRQYMVFKTKGQGNWRGLLVCGLLCLLATLCTFAQGGSTTAQITGTVKDPGQAVLANVPVVLTNVQTNEKATAVTNGQGVYKFSALPAGTYTVQPQRKRRHQRGRGPERQQQFLPDAGRQCRDRHRAGRSV
jgi:hypothetical protein